MSGRRYTAGIAVLSFLIFSAIVAPSAFAEQLTYECSSAAPVKTFSDAHCISAGGSSFGHILIGEGVATVGSNEKTTSETTAAAPTRLKSSIAGVETEVTCQKTHTVSTS